MSAEPEPMDTTPAVEETEKPTAEVTKPVEEAPKEGLAVDKSEPATETETPVEKAEIPVAESEAKPEEDKKMEEDTPAEDKQIEQSKPAEPKAPEEQATQPEAKTEVKETAPTESAPSPAAVELPNVIPQPSTPVVLTENIQKIVAVEKESASKQKPKVDLQSLPTRQYLDQSVVPILLQGLTALSKERPSEPIDFLAAYLMKNKHLYNK